MFTFPIGYLTNNDKDNSYGKLYNWYAVTAITFAPSGWHVPTQTDYTTLRTTLGGGTVAGGPMKLTGTEFWSVANGTNTSGFSGVGNGKRDFDGSFIDLKIKGMLWSKTESTSTTSWVTILVSITNTNNQASKLKENGYGVRLIKDDSTDPGSLTDYDGNDYRTIKIGSQVFTAQNWKCTHLNDGTSIPNIIDDIDWSNLSTMGWCYYNNNPKYN